MKKSSFAALVLGTVSGVFFALGMCMALVEEWNAFKPGIVFGCAGILLALVTVFVWRKMEKKPPIKISGKAILTVVVGTVGALALGIGMCFCMVWNNMVAGVLIGVFGIVVILCFIPLTRGLK